MTDDRPDHIAPADWYRMGWYARQKAKKRLGLGPIIIDEDETPVATVTRLPKRKDGPKVTVRRVEPGWWEATYGTSTARATRPEVLWRLVTSLSRAS